MIRLLIIVFIFLSCFFCAAQEKFDYQWPIGFPPEAASDTLFGPRLIDFNEGSLKILKIPKASLITLNSIASICDQNGKLTLYSNGCQIHNGNFELVEGCENINPGDVWDDYCGYPASYPSMQSQVFLPYPGKENQYLYLTLRLAINLYHYNTKYYQCNVIDMSLSNGKGKSIQNFEIEYPDVVKGYNLAVCKHANGKDWWIITFSFAKQKFYRLLLTQDGIEGPYEQEGGPPNENESDIGQSVFSPDGKKFATIFSNTGKGWLLDFDRQTGLFSNKKEMTYLVKEEWDVRGISFSPNSRFIYVSADFYMYQFDAIASNLQESQVLLDSNDNYGLPGFPYYIEFGFQQLGPDGKIYVGQFIGGIRQWSIIENPDEKGIACQFKQHSITFPTYSLGCPPIQPNFRLGPDTATLVKNIIPSEIQLKSWFNPSGREIKCLLQGMDSGQDYLITITDIFGRPLFKKELKNVKYQEEITFDGSPLSAGMYTAIITSKEKIVGNAKIFIY